MEHSLQTHCLMSRMNWFVHLNRLFNRLSGDSLAGTVQKAQFIAGLWDCAQLQYPAQYLASHNVRPLSYQEVAESLSAAPTMQLTWDQVLDRIVYSSSQAATAGFVVPSSSSCHSVKSPGMCSETVNAAEGSKQGTSIEICYPAEKIVQVPEHLFTGTVQFLSLAGNAIDHTQWAFPPSLVVLNLAGNEIKEVSFIVSFIHLKLLNLSNNRISRVSVPSQYRGITEFYIGYNSITQLNSFSHFSNLKVLDVSYNEINSVEGVAGLTALTAVRVKGNPRSDSFVQLFPSHCEIDPKDLIAFSEFATQCLPFIPLKRPPRQAVIQRTDQGLLTPPPMSNKRTVFTSSFRLENSSITEQFTKRLPKSSSMTRSTSKAESTENRVVITKQQILNSTFKTYDNPVKAMMIGPHPLRHSINPMLQKSMSSAASQLRAKPVIGNKRVKK